MASPWQFTQYGQGILNRIVAAHPELVAKFGGLDAMKAALLGGASGITAQNTPQYQGDMQAYFLRSVGIDPLKGADPALAQAMLDLMNPALYRNPDIPSTQGGGGASGITQGTSVATDWSMFSGGPPTEAEFAQINALRAMDRGTYPTPQVALMKIRQDAAAAAATARASAQGALDAGFAVDPSRVDTRAMVAAILGANTTSPSATGGASIQDIVNAVQTPAPAQYTPGPATAPAPAQYTMGPATAPLPTTIQDIVAQVAGGSGSGAFAAPSGTATQFTSTNQPASYTPGPATGSGYTPGPASAAFNLGPGSISPSAQGTTLPQTPTPKPTPAPTYTPGPATGPTPTPAPTYTPGPATGPTPTPAPTYTPGPATPPPSTYTPALAAPSGLPGNSYGLPKETTSGREIRYPQLTDPTNPNNGGADTSSVTFNQGPTPVPGSNAPDPNRSLDAYVLQQLVNGMVPSAQGREILQLISGPERSKAVLDALAARALAPSAALQGVPSASSTVATPTPEPSYGAVSDGAPITGTSTTLPGVMNLGPGWDIYDSWKTPNQRVVEAERAAAQGGGATAATPQAGVDAQIADILRNLSSAQGNTPVNAPLDLSKALAQPTTAYSTNIPAGYNVSGAVTGGLANANAQTRSVQDLVNQLAGFQGTVGAPSLTPTGGGTAYGGANEAALRNQLAQTATQGGNIRDVVNAVVTSQPSTGIPALDAGMAQAKSAQPLANQLANFEGGVTGQTITDEQTLAAIDNLINTGAINTLSPAEQNSLNTLRSNLTTSVMNGPKVPTAEAAQVGTQAVGNAQRLLDATGGPSPSRAGLAPALANAEARMGRPMTQSEIDSVANAYNYATSKWGKAAGDAMERIVAANAASNPQVAAQRDLLSGLQARASGQLSEAEMAALNRTADTTALDEASGRGRDDVLNAIIAEAMGQTSKSQMNAEAAMLDMAKVQANAQNSQLGELLAQRGMVGSGAGIGLAQDATNELLGNVVSQAQMQREANRQQALQNYQSYTGQLSNQSLAERQFALQDAMSRAGFSADQINAAMGQLNALTGQMAQQSAGQGQLTASLDEAARQRAQEASTTNAQLTQQTRQADLDRQMAERGRVSQDLLSTLGLAQQGALGAEQIAAGQRVAGTELLTGARTNEAQMQQQAQAQNMAAELQARGMSADLSMQIASQLMSAGNIEANLATRQAELAHDAQVQNMAAELQAKGIAADTALQMARQLTDTAEARGGLEAQAAGIRQTGAAAGAQDVLAQRQLAEEQRQFNVTAQMEQERMLRDDSARIRDQGMQLAALSEDISKGRITLQEAIETGRWSQYMDAINQTVQQAVQREGLDLQARGQLLSFMGIIKEADRSMAELAQRRAEQQALMTAAEKQRQADNDAGFMNFLSTLGAGLVTVGVTALTGGNVAAAAAAGSATKAGLDYATDKWGGGATV